MKVCVDLESDVGADIVIIIFALYESEWLFRRAHASMIEKNIMLKPYHIQR